MFGCSQEEDENVVSHRVSMQTLTSAGGHFEFSNGAIATYVKDIHRNIHAIFQFNPFSGS
jgi:hypothetical protein